MAPDFNPAKTNRYIGQLPDFDVNNLNVIVRLVLLVRFDVLNAMNNVHASCRATKDGVFVIQPGLKEDDMRIALHVKRGG